MKRKIYVLVGGCIDDKHVVAVFSSQKQAKQAREKIIASDHYYKSYPEDLEIEQYEINTLPEVIKCNVEDDFS